MSDQVRQITLNNALQISLDNYYDLLKDQSGGLGAQEFLQLKLVADGVDISDKVKEGTEEQSYIWFSYRNLRNRSDLNIIPSQVDTTVYTGAVQLTDVYGKFLSRLSALAVAVDLSADDQLAITGYNAQIDHNNGAIQDLRAKDNKEWIQYCNDTGTDQKDPFAKVNWRSAGNGESRAIADLNADNFVQDKKIKTIRLKQYPDPDDRAIILAEQEFDKPEMQLCYPTQPDYLFLPTVISLGYLAGLEHADSSVFESRRVITWDKTLGYIKTANQGTFTAKLYDQTQSSSSITTDWGNQGQVSYWCFSVKTDIESHESIQEEFNTATELDLKANATIRVNITYGSWFKPELFVHKHVKENLDLFKEFFGTKGSLLYYPTALILVRGFGITFKNSQEWKYDYEKKFSISGSGGFNIFGIDFGGGSNYGQHWSQHTVHKAGTELTISDDDSSLRFVGYVVKKNDFVINSLITHFNSLGLVEKDK